jgi:CRP-like cAMP-binding protein
MIDHDARLLGASELFGGLELRDRQRVARLCSRRRVAARQVVFNQGEPGREMFVVASGRLKISVISAEGKELSFFILDSGSIFGELALLDGERRSATVTAITPCELLVLHVDDFKRLLKDNQLIGLRMLSILAGRVRATSALYESSVFIEIPGRLASRLLELAGEYGVESDADGSILIDLKLSQYELGTLINASRESVNKQLKTWQAQDIIAISGGRIEIREPELLEALC